MARQKIIHKRTSVPNKLPIVSGTSDEALNYGEIAINYADGSELLIIRNANNSAVTFSPTNKLSEGPTASTGYLLTSVSGNNIYKRSILASDIPTAITVSNSDTVDGKHASDFVLTPSANTANFVPQWNGTNSKTLKNGLELTTSVPSSASTDTEIPSTKSIYDCAETKATQFPGICSETPILASDISINYTTRVLTINRVGGFHYFTDGNGIITKHVVSGSVSFPAFTDTSGVWNFYFDNAGNAVTTQGQIPDFNTIAMVYRILWNATLTGSSKSIVEIYECHENTISGVDHTWKHKYGAVHVHGGDCINNKLTTGSPNIDGRNTVIALTTLTNLDDNLEYTITNSTSGAIWQQALGNTNPALLNATNSALFKIRVQNSGGLVFYLPATRFPFSWDSATNRPEYITSSGVRTLVDNGDFFVYYIYSVQDPRNGEAIKSVSAPTSFTTLTNAQSSSWGDIQAIYTTLNDNEIRPLYRLIFATSPSWDVSIKKSMLYEVQDLRVARVTATNASGAILASAVNLIPVGGVSSTNVQSAIEELDVEKVSWGGDTIGVKKTIGSVDNYDIGIKTNNIERITVTKDGKVGMSNTSPTSQISQKSTLATESAPLGSELIDTNNWTATSGWSGNYTTGFSHASGGGITTLSRTMSITTNTLYQVSWTVTGRTSGSFSVSLGGQRAPSDFTSSGNFGPRTLNSTSGLIFTPTNDFNGTITNISVKLINGTYGAIFDIQDNTGVSNFEVRNSLNTLTNTFIGKNAGRYNTTGYGNAALGVNALQWNTTGFLNVATGINALSLNTTGYYNTAYGNYALNNNTYGIYNTSVGHYSLYTNTNGIYNTAIGPNALNANISGSFNTANGPNALLANINGNFNVGNGAYSLYANTIGSYNVGIGASAGRYLIDGVTGKLSGDNCTYIGYNSKASADGTSNENVIGYNAIGAGSNSVVLGNSAVTKTLLNGNVGINNSNPTAQLSQKSTLETESAPLGGEITNATNWTLTSGWSGDYANGFTHTSGAGVTTLSRAMAINTGSIYQISWTVTNRTSGSFTVTLGGQMSPNTFTSTGSYGPKTLNSTGPLIFTPTSDFNGTISLVSVKQNTGTYGATFDIQDSTGVSTLEIRSSLRTLNNTFIGRDVGSRNTLGNNNSFLGASAGQNNTTGHNNSFFGASAGLNNTVGNTNSFFGYAAGLNNTVGNNNSFMGMYAGYSNTTGNFNSFFGYAAGLNNTVGNTNSFIGYVAGMNNTTGNSNSFMGFGAGQNNTTGNNNSFMGYGAGRYIADGVTGRITGENGLYLGYNSKASANGTDNEIVIGYNAIGAGSNSVVLGNSAVTKTYLKGDVSTNGTITGSNLSGTNTGDETTSTIKTKLGITTLSGSNTGDETAIRLGLLGATINRGEWIDPTDEVDSVNYYINDIIYYNSNNYICILAHPSFNAEKIYPTNTIYWTFLSTIDYNNLLNLPSLDYLGLDGGSMNSTNLVTNLNADFLDGNHASAFSLTSHTHTNYSLTGHTHTNYSLTGHTHTSGDITNFASAVTNSETKLSLTTTASTASTGYMITNVSNHGISSRTLIASDIPTAITVSASVKSTSARQLNGANGTKVVGGSDEAGNTKFLEVYCNGSYIYMIGNSTNGSAGNMVFQPNNAGQVVFNTSNGGAIILQTNGSGATYLNTPDFVVNTNNHIQTDAASSVINKLPNRAGRLMVEERITISQSAPSGGIDGDIWITY